MAQYVPKAIPVEAMQFLDDAPSASALFTLAGAVAFNWNGPGSPFHIVLSEGPDVVLTNTDWLLKAQDGSLWRVSNDEFVGGFSSYP